MFLYTFVVYVQLTKKIFEMCVQQILTIWYLEEVQEGEWKLSQLLHSYSCCW